MSNENHPPQQGQNRPIDDSPLTLPSRRKAGPPDYWKDKGRHIGRTIHIFLNVGQLILAGLQLDKDLALCPDNEIEKYPAEIRLQYKTYRQVLSSIPRLEEGLANKTINAENLNGIATRIQSGVNAARSDDNKGIKHAIIVWIADPVKGLAPPIDPGLMHGRGWNHDATGRELCPAGLDWNDESIKASLSGGTMVVSSDQWPICFYLNGLYDPEEPWIGLLRGRLLVNAFKHIFTSPSSVTGSRRATKASNSANHGMTKVTEASIAYVATLVRFALGTDSSFCRNSTVTDSQTFYNVMLAFLNHPHERENVNELLTWWNKQVFPHAVAAYRAPTANSALARCVAARKKRLALQATGVNESR